MLATDFLEALYEGCRDVPGVVELRRLPNEDTAENKWLRDRLFAVDLATAAEALNNWDRHDLPAGVFYGVAMRYPGSKRGRKEDVSAVPALWADVDVGKMGWDMGRTIAAIKASPIRPSVVVNSGNGLHLYWVLDKPIPLPPPDDIERAHVIDMIENTMRGLAGIFAGDNTVDVSRILRVPGTWHTKGKPVQVKIEFGDWRTYSFGTLFRAHEEVQSFLDRDGWLSAEQMRAKIAANKEVQKGSALSGDMLQVAGLGTKKYTWDGLWAHARPGGGQERGTAWIGLDEAMLRGLAMLYAKYAGIWTAEQIIDEVLKQIEKIQGAGFNRKREYDKARDKLKRFDEKWNRLVAQRKLQDEAARGRRKRNSSAARGGRGTGVERG